MNNDVRAELPGFWWLMGMVFVAGLVLSAAMPGPWFGA